MTSQTGKLIIAIHIVPNISKTKGSETMKFGELIEYNIRKISLQNHAVNEAGRLVLGKSSW